ncbi:MAG: phenylalanine--tRNA ligase subunit beta [Candidatus Diapherotrites archaeon]|uniref:phenylalanine--tRNA ligase n=1 Tax=Candidatus Iainarchaeum sp. TaxID=3101447 RepID=A0A2D6M0D1_9ARCH|nr:phenylalanine--tRNA ligase subunit beta [Candidatus Diapherotrites archaeon]|tara:strand:- start:2210 stop:3856 length:1647 start_codon:yes stop_codon:yes gene_type:complete
MPNVNVSLKDIGKLVGKKLSVKEFKEAVLYAKGEVDAIEGDMITVDMKDTNRPDLLSAEGLAREIRSRITRDRGITKYKIRKGNIELLVDKNVANIRPYIAAAIVKNVKVTEDFLIQIIQLQEKVCLTFGRKRKEAAIGLYDWTKLKGPMHYRAYKPREKKFIPLEYKVEMDLEEILEDHPTGREYKHLLEGKNKYPIFEDNNGVVASMPPIINSQITGKVSENTKEVLVEVTGHNQERVNTALNVMVSALAERGFDIYSVKVRYPNRTVITPDFTPKKVSVNLDSIRSFSGMDLSNKQIVELLQKARYDAKISGKKVVCQYPSYRQDILHPVDVIEDVLISYGYGNIEPTSIESATIGSERIETKQVDLARDICVGLGLQEILTYTMTSKKKQTETIDLDPEKEKFVEIENPMSENYAIFRKRLFPELLEFLSKNKHNSYPQKIFEVGKTLELDAKSETGVNEKNTLCIILIGKGAEFNTIKSVLDAITSNKGETYSLKETQLPFLEKGKQAELALGKRKGFIGEVSKSTLNKFGLEQKTVVLELEI